MTTAQRRQSLKEALIDAAEGAIAARGLGGLRARELAAQVGCAVGAIYNVVDDLDDLVLAVNSRTLAALEGELERAAHAKGYDARPAIGWLIRMAIAYLDYAATNTMRWRALFEHRLPEGKPMPDWYLAEQTRLFGHVERPLRELQPDLSPGESVLLARSLFSAVHGIVMLGLEEKLGAIPLDALRTQTTRIVTAIGSGLDHSRPKRTPARR